MTDSHPPSPFTLRLAHSPDPDDAFMWWPLFSVDRKPPALQHLRFRFEPIALDIETLNERSEAGDYEITAMSCAQYARVSGRYAITSCGASMGEGYGPKLVARKPMTVQQLRESGETIAVPGLRTSACLALRLLMGETPTDPLPLQAVSFEEILDCIAQDRFAAGVVIHEGQLQYESLGLHLVRDLGEWWQAEHHLPLPLGLNCIRRDLENSFGDGTLRELAAMLHRSVVHALEHRAESLDYALRFGRGIDAATADAFVHMYVNTKSLHFGVEGRRAVEVFLGEAVRAGLLPAMRDDMTVIEPESTRH